MGWLKIIQNIYVEIVKQDFSFSPFPFPIETRHTRRKEVCETSLRNVEDNESKKKVLATVKCLITIKMYSIPIGNQENPTANVKKYITSHCEM